MRISGTLVLGTPTGLFAFGADGFVMGGGRITGGGGGFERLELPALFTKLGGLNGLESPEVDPKGFVAVFTNWVLLKMEPRHKLPKIGAEVTLGFLEEPSTKFVPGRFCAPYMPPEGRLLLFSGPENLLEKALFISLVLPVGIGRWGMLTRASSWEDNFKILAFVFSGYLQIWKEMLIS